MAAGELASIGLGSPRGRAWTAASCGSGRRIRYTTTTTPGTWRPDPPRACRQSYPGMHLVGRNGMHKYNNQDHAMMTGMLTARNIIAGTTLYDVWAVNEEAEYLEGSTLGGATGERLVPQEIRERPLGAAAQGRKAARKRRLATPGARRATLGGSTLARVSAALLAVACAARSR